RRLRAGLAGRRARRGLTGMSVRARHRARGSDTLVVGLDRRREPMYTSRDGVKLFYQVTGSGGRDLFLLPPWPPAPYSRQWKNQVPYLSRYFRVVTMDLRGNGRSDRPAGGYDLDTRYQDFLAVLETAVRPPFALVAYSCAGMLAFRYAVEHPDRLSHLI